MIRINANTPDELANEFAKAAKLKQWHFYTGTINGKAVEVKAYGLYVQIFRIDGLNYSEPEFKTQKAMKAHFIHSITPAFAAVADIKRYLEKGNGIYNSVIGGRYFDARVNDKGELECYHGYESDDNNGWIVIPPDSKWHGPHGERVYIHRN